MQKFAIIPDNRIRCEIEDAISELNNFAKNHYVKRWELIRFEKNNLFRIFVEYDDSKEKLNG